MVQAAICKYIILPDTDRKKGDLQYPHPNVVHRRKEFDLTGGQVPNIIVCTSILWRADKPGSRTPGFTDGAKIYLCNRRCCFLTWKGRSCLLYRLSPRESRFQSHPAKVRSVPEC